MIISIQKIDPNSIVKSGKQGYLYCVTDPPHPQGETRGDRKKKYVYMHRAVMENELGRYLKPGEEVDHNDRNVTNNEPSNLTLRLVGEHQREHAFNGNSFWEKSPRNKPKNASALEVIRIFLDS